MMILAVAMLALNGASSSMVHRRCAISMMADSVTCTVRKQPKSAVALDISVPASVSREVHDKVMQEFSKTAKVPGFRPGKVPQAALISALGMSRIKVATVEQLIDVGMQQGGNQVRVNTVGEAKLVTEVEELASKYVIGEQMDFTVLVDVYPEVPVSEDMYSTLKVEVERVEFNQAAYDSALFKLRDQHAALIEAAESDTAEEGMQLLINMEGFAADSDGAKGEPLPAVAGGEGVQLPLKPGKFMPGLVEGLIGIKRGEVRDITVTFPSRTSVPELAGKEAVFEVTCVKVQKRVLPDPDDDFATKVKTGMSWDELDSKLREGVQAEANEIQRRSTHKALEQALVTALPAEFEVPETLLDQVGKERFTAMLADMRERGSSDEELKELITKENYDRYLAITRPSSAIQVKADFALKEVGRQQGLSIDRDAVDDEVMTLQAQAVQRGEKFKESEVRPKIEAANERAVVLDYLSSQADVTIVEPGSKDVDPAEMLGASPEELALSVAAGEAAAAGDAGAAPPPSPEAVAPPPAVEVVQAVDATPPPTTDEPPTDAAAESETPPAGKAQSPDGFEWGGTF